MDNNSEINILEVGELANLFGTTTDEIESYCGPLLEGDLRYRLLDSKERDQLILQLIKDIQYKPMSVSGKDRQSDWEKGWTENLDDFVQSGYQLDKLIPKYFKKNVPVRLNQDYVMPLSPNFVYEYTDIYRTWLFKKYFQDWSNIYEFGCGPAYHLVYLAHLYPEKRFVGFDWALSSQRIIDLVSERYKLPITGHRFDFFDPDYNLVMDKESAILTFGALEQVGEHHVPFLDFLLRKKPGICVNVECIKELYSTDDLVSYLALQYHEKRNYLSGYLTSLQRLEREGRVEIIKYHHHPFGNITNDTLSYVIWKPL